MQDSEQTRIIISFAWRAEFGDEYEPGHDVDIVHIFSNASVPVPLVGENIVFEHPSTAEYLDEDEWRWLCGVVRKREFQYSSQNMGDGTHDLNAVVELTVGDVVEEHRP